MTTWSESIDHPWFDKPRMKRKHPLVSHSNASPSPDDSDTCTPPPGLKRRRCNTLESGFAHLTLNNPLLVNDSSVSTSVLFPNPTLPQSPLYPNTNVSLPFAIDADSPTPPVLCPTSTEHPISPLSSSSTPPIADIKMKSSSWYEPEPDRIIITALDSSSDEEDTGDGPDPEPPSIAISPVLLERIKSRSLQTNMGAEITREPSNALVLFRPIPGSGSVQHSEGSDADVVDTQDGQNGGVVDARDVVDMRGHIVVDTRGAVVVNRWRDDLVDTKDDDAMDVEP